MLSQLRFASGGKSRAGEAGLSVNVLIPVADPYHTCTALAPLPGQGILRVRQVYLRTPSFLD